MSRPTLGDAWEPPTLPPGALDWFDDERPPTPASLAIRTNKRRGKTYLRWVDEHGDRHGLHLDTHRLK